MPLLKWKAYELKAGGHLIFFFHFQNSVLTAISYKVFVNNRDDELGGTPVYFKHLYRDNKKLVKIYSRKAQRHFQIIKAMCRNMKSAPLGFFKTN